MSKDVDRDDVVVAGGVEEWDEDRPEGVDDATGDGELEDDGVHLPLDGR